MSLAIPYQRCGYARSGIDRPRQIVWRKGGAGYVLVAGIYTLVALSVLAAVGGYRSISLGHYYLQFGAIYTVVLVLALAIGLALRMAGRPIVERDGALRLDREGLWSSGIPVLLVIPTFMSAFTSLKNALPDLHPFSWDARLERLDRWLHFGKHPWEWLDPIVGYPWMTGTIEALYTTWLLLVVLSVIYFACQRGPRRQQFLLSFILAWIVVGTIAAFLLSSAGPCYFGKVTGLPDPYRPLLDYLRAPDGITPSHTAYYQDLLWQTYVDRSPRAFTGISAMPSMHLSITTLFVLAFWQSSKLVRAVLLAYLAIILVGSVHLAWHYAVDGYVSIALTCGIWKAVAWFLSNSRFPVR